MVDEHRGYGSEAGELFRTSDGGKSWAGTKLPGIVYIDHITFMTPEVGWISGGTGTDGNGVLVFRTVDGGEHWEPSRITPPRHPADVRDLYFLDQQHGWLLTWGYNDDGSYLYSTADGGEHWTADPDFSFQGKGRFATVVRFTSLQTGFLFADGRLLFTSDGGKHWHPDALKESVYDCQVFEGDLLCSAALGLRILTLHPE